jgi:F-type H+-transporting ATPase subunit delta
MNADVIVAEFISYLKTRGLLDLLPEIAEKLTTASYTQVDPYLATVVTAVALKTSQKQLLAQSLSKIIGHKIRLRTRLDPTVVAGMKIIIGGKIIDTTFSTQLKDLSQVINYD